MDTIHFIHLYPDKILGSYEIRNGIYWGGDFEAAIHLLKNGEISLSRNPLLYWLFWMVGRTTNR